jgi:hypothetical protein
MEELGLDRPAYFFLVSGVALQGDDGARMPEILNPYATIFDTNLAAASAARGAGLIEEVGGRWRATPKGRAVASAFRRELDAYFATLEPVPTAEITRMASLLGQALRALESSDVPKDHLRRLAHYGGDAKIPMSALDRTVFGLWQGRDDCHMASWREAGFDGPTFDVLTRLWREEATTEDDLAAKLGGQRPDDVRSSLAKLRKDGLVRADTVAVTPRGRDARQAIEDETDTRFFSPWPDEIGAQGGWLTRQLAAINEALQPAS